MLALGSVGALAVLALSGCSSSAPDAAFGSALQAKVDNDDDGTKGTVDLTVSEPKTLSMAESGLDLGSEYENGTVFFVPYSAKLSDGEYGADDTYSFSTYEWGADATSGEDATTVKIGIGGEAPADCPSFESSNAAALAGGDTVEACAIFASTEADDGLKTVVFGAPSVRAKGQNNGYSWGVTE
jgi:hypothetical protein